MRLYYNLGCDHLLDSDVFLVFKENQKYISQKLIQIAKDNGTINFKLMPVRKKGALNYSNFNKPAFL